MTKSRQESLRSIYATQRKARNRDPGWMPDYIKKLPEDALAWLADFEATADGHKAPAARIKVTPEMQKELNSDRYKRDEVVKNSGKVFSKAPEDISKLVDRMAVDGQDICPFAPGTSKEAD